MSIKKHYFSWEDYDYAIQCIVEYYESQNLDCGAVYGLPRGGLPIAVSLSHRLNLPLYLDKSAYMGHTYVNNLPMKLLIIDDIIAANDNKQQKILDKLFICARHYQISLIVCYQYIKKDFT